MFLEKFVLIMWSKDIIILIPFILTFFFFHFPALADKNLTNTAIMNFYYAYILTKLSGIIGHKCFYLQY